MFETMNVHPEFHKDFYLIGDGVEMICKEDVTQAEWNKIWSLAIKHDVCITHWRSYFGGLHKVRWRKGREV